MARSETRRKTYQKNHAGKDPMAHLTLRSQLLRKAARELDISEADFRWNHGVLQMRISHTWYDVPNVQKVPKPATKKPRETEGHRHRLW